MPSLPAWNFCDFSFQEAIYYSILYVITFTVQDDNMGRPRKYKEPTMEELRAEASKHATKTEFNKASPKLYRYAWSNGLLDELCAHMFDARKEWTLEKLQAEAAKYTTRSDFQKANNKAYQAARYHGFLDQVCSHMDPRSKSDYDTIYIAHLPGTDIYKVGLTSKRLGLNRLNQIQPAVTLIAYVCFDKQVSQIEQALLRIGQKIEGEFRRWSPKDLEQAMCVLGKYLAIL